MNICVLVINFDLYITILTEPLLKQMLRYGENQSVTYDVISDHALHNISKDAADGKFNVLSNYIEKDSSARSAIDVISKTYPSFQGPFISYEDGVTGLRSMLAHSQSTGECLQNGFVVHGFEDSRYLRIDLELSGFGILNLAHKLSREVAYTLLNLVAIYSGFEKSLPYQDCDVTWSPGCVFIADYIDQTGQGVPISVINPNLSGLTISTLYVKPEIFNALTRE